MCGNVKQDALVMKVLKVQGHLVTANTTVQEFGWGKIYLLCLFSAVLQEENEVTEFFVTLEKDPQQEDFLQGRMPGNPYSSNEPGIGPLMRDIKNKICQDCDLVALLEDDSGMEVRLRECDFLHRCVGTPYLGS